ncbi:TrgA family protein [Thalassovita sp.]|uniref:TrgA family protein n=1 Tax=Thalassovita sp. TaxID=1979401 RepID=UPI00288231AD|nr:TrgA family protein [Thalassovita sp.]MDF1804581.1 TrgA family protein [Thalassovita sp.]
MMPTAARLIAALVLAATAWLVSQTIKTHLPEGTQFGWFDYVNVALGALVGWITIGGRSGRGMSAAVGNGLTGIFMLLLWAIFLQASNEMLRQALRRYYRGPVEALLDVFDIGMEYALIVVNLDVAVPLLVGGILAGILSELGGRHWR